jgi:DNA polymerase I
VEFERVDEIIRLFTIEIEKFCKQEGLDITLGMKLDVYFERMLSTGAKKRYAGLVVWEDGKKLEKPYVMVKGFEYVRRDASLLTKKLQKEMFEKILRGASRKDIIDYVHQVLVDIRDNKIPLDEIANRKTIHKAFASYKPIPDFVRAAIYSRTQLGFDIRPSDSVKYIWVKSVEGKPRTDIVGFLDANLLPNIQVDVAKVAEKTIHKKVEKLLSLIGVNWNEVQLHQAPNIGDVL